MPIFTARASSALRWASNTTSSSGTIASTSVPAASRAPGSAERRTTVPVTGATIGTRTSERRAWASARSPSRAVIESAAPSRHSWAPCSAASDS